MPVDLEIRVDTPPDRGADSFGPSEGREGTLTAELLGYRVSVGAEGRILDQRLWENRDEVLLFHREGRMPRHWWETAER
jgi:hypothetical protein